MKDLGRLHADGTEYRPWLCASSLRRRLDRRRRPVVDDNQFWDNDGQHRSGNFQSLEAQYNSRTDRSNREGTSSTNLGERIHTFPNHKETDDFDSLTSDSQIRKTGSTNGDSIDMGINEVHSEEGKQRFSADTIIMGIKQSTKSNGAASHVEASLNGRKSICEGGKQDTTMCSNDGGKLK